MDLTDYLNSYIKGKKISKKKKEKKIKKGEFIRNRIPRRARGYGQRGSKYYNSKNKSNRDDIDKQLLALLTTLTKQNQPTIDLSKPEALNPFVERDRQIYSMKFDSNKKPDKEEQFTMDEKKGIRKAITLPEENPAKIRETQNLIFNISQDLDSRVQEVLEEQQEILTELQQTKLISPAGAKDVRDKNLRLKEQVLSETTRLQEMLNDAEDLNDYRELIQKQNKMIDDTTRGFAEIDNNLSLRQVEETEKLQTSTKMMGEKMEEMVEKIGGRQEDLEMREEELEVLGEEMDTLKLTLERNELREQKLKQQLTEMESIIDKQNRELFDLERAVRVIEI
jgi:hypothetical protein